MAHILLIDDDALFREQAVSILLEVGYQIDAVASGEEALECLKIRKYDLLLVDLILTRSAVHKQGIDVLDYWKQTGSNAQVIAYSNKANDKAVRQVASEAYNIYRFLNKFNITPSRLKKQVNGALNYRSIVQNAVWAPDNSLILRGVTQGLHHIIQDYVEGFEDYLWDFKNIAGNISVRKEKDDLIIQFHTDADIKKVGGLFKEFMYYLQSAEEVNPVFELERSITQDESQRLTAALREQIANCSRELSYRLWDENGRDYTGLDEVDGYSDVVTVNVQKISNSHILQRRNRVNYRMAESYKLLCETVNEHIKKDEVLSALGVTEAFCEEWHLKTIKNQVVSLHNRYERARNRYKAGRIDDEKMDTAVARIVLTLLDDVLGDVEKHVQG